MIIAIIAIINVLLKEIILTDSHKDKYSAFQSILQLSDEYFSRPVFLSEY